MEDNQQAEGSTLQVHVEAAPDAGSQPDPNAPAIETVTYADGTAATGVAPLPKLSPAEQDALYGSSMLPPLIDIGGFEVQLGTVVAAAYTASGLSVADWNSLSEDDRDAKLMHQIETMRVAARAMAKAYQTYQSSQQPHPFAADSPSDLEYTNTDLGHAQALPELPNGAPFERPIHRWPAIEQFADTGGRTMRPVVSGGKFFKMEV